MRGPQVLSLDMTPYSGDRGVFVALPDELVPQTGQGQTDLQFIGYVSRIDEKNEFKKSSAPVTFKPFADVQNAHVWLMDQKQLPTGKAPVTYGGKESQSRRGTMTEGPFTDLRIDTMSSTRDNRRVNEDWFAVELEKPAKISRVVYRHGTVRPDGGWFDTTAGKPRIEYKATPDGQWQKLGTLDTYPDTRPNVDPQLLSGQPFELKLKEPVTISAIRVIGKAASGGNPRKNFVTCSELQAYED
jgi:hypothetical protein